MPLTPLHLSPALALFAMRPRKWSFPALMIGSVIPDIEVPILYLSGLEMQTGHGALHSILGALTIDIVLAIMAVYILYPALIGMWRRKFGRSWSHVAGVDVGDIGGLPLVAYSALAGVLMHISIDYLTHFTMPYFWPFAAPVATMPYGRELWWLAAVNAFLFAVQIFLLKRHVGMIGNEPVKTAG